MKAKDRVFGNLVRYKPTKYHCDHLGIILQPWETRHLDTFWLTLNGTYRLETIDFLDIVGEATLEQLKEFDRLLEAWNERPQTRGHLKDLYHLWKSHYALKLQQNQDSPESA